MPPIAACARQAVQSGGKGQVCNNHCRHEVQAQNPRITNAIGGAGEGKERVTAVLRGKQSQEQNGESEARPCEIEILQRVGFTFRACEPTESDQRQQIDADERPCAGAERHEVSHVGVLRVTTAFGE